MCFQGFAKFQCGHAQVWEEECEHAQQLDLPLWLKVACPYYSNQSKQTDTLCGTYKYYCKKTADGEYIEQVHDSRTKAEEEYKDAHDQIMSRWNPLLNKRFEQWKAEGKTPETFITRPEVLRVKLIMSDLNEKRARAQQQIARLDYIISQARNFFTRKQQLAAHKGVSLANMLHPAGVQQDLSVQPQREIPFTPGLAFAAGPKPALPLEIQPMGETTKELLRRLGSTQTSYAPLAPAAPTGSRMLQLTPEQLARMQQSYQNVLPEARESQQKRGRATRKAAQKIKQESSPEKQSSSIRRSTRVRDKKVNYVEDGSEASRSPSPVKSEVSNFSPSKSEASGTPRGSPKKRTSIIRDTFRKRASSSLADKIGEWNRRESTANVTGTPPPARGDDRGDVLRAPGSHSQKQKFEEDDDGGTPETILLSGSENRPELTDPSDQNWLINSTHVAFGAAPETHFQAPAAPMVQQAQAELTQNPQTDYEQLRQSFNSTTDLLGTTMPSTIAYDSPHYMPPAEPTKRQPFDSSPPHSAKHMRHSPPEATTLSGLEIVAPPDGTSVASVFDPSLVEGGPQANTAEDIFSDIDWSVYNENTFL